MQETWVRSLGQEDSPGEGNDYLLQFLPGKFHGSGAWRATVHGVTKSWTRLSYLAHKVNIKNNKRTKVMTDDKMAECC